VNTGTGHLQVPNLCRHPPLAANTIVFEAALPLSGRFLQESTIYAADVFYKIINFIESTYSRLTKVLIDNRMNGVKRKVKTNAKLGKAYRASLFQKHYDQTSLKQIGQQRSKRFPYAASTIALSRSSTTFVEADESLQPRLKGKKYEKVRCSSVFSKCL
jgi:hypothetical protein